MSGLPLCTVADGNLNLDLREIQQGRQRIKRSTLRSLASSSFRVPVTHQNEAQATATTWGNTAGVTDSRKERSLKRLFLSYNER